MSAETVKISGKRGQEAPGLNAPKQILSRRLRPKRFQDLVGQDLFVQLFQNAFHKKLMTNALLFTGMRGVGKTTSARLVAKLLSCKNPVTEAGLSEPCGICDACRAIDSESYADLIEMDAASHTGVDDVRQILDASQYHPLMGAYKIFIVDEVHMLSKSAFNAFLKTLENPPKHVIFLFATTEVQKIPLTVLSRCLRFQMRRVSIDVLSAYLHKVCAQEGFTVEKEAMRLLVKNTEGSVRDALSLLDQAFLLQRRESVQTDNQIAIGLSVIRELLGLRDEQAIEALLKACMAGNAPDALRLARVSYDEGGDPLMMLEQLLDYVHRLSDYRVHASLNDGGAIEKDSALGAPDLQFSLALLGRCWQMLQKGRQEVVEASLPQQAFEMVLIRLCCATELPSPESLFQLQEKKKTLMLSTDLKNKKKAGVPVQAPYLLIDSVEKIQELLVKKREGLLLAYMKNSVEVQFMQPGKIDFLAIAKEKDSSMSPDLFVKNLKAFLEKETQDVWLMTVQYKQTIHSIESKKAADEARVLEEASADPRVKKAQLYFPKLKVISFQAPSV